MKDHPLLNKPIEWVYTPTRTGDDIIVTAVVREVLNDGFLIDTENQKGVKVRSKDVREKQ